MSNSWLLQYAFITCEMSGVQWPWKVRYIFYCLEKSPLVNKEETSYLEIFVLDFSDWKIFFQVYFQPTGGLDLWNYTWKQWLGRKGVPFGCLLVLLGKLLWHLVAVVGIWPFLGGWDPDWKIWTFGIVFREEMIGEKIIRGSCFVSNGYQVSFRSIRLKSQMRTPCSANSF